LKIGNCDPPDRVNLFGPRPPAIACLRELS